MTWQEIIKEYSSASEQSGTLHPSILNIAYQQNWFKLFVPAQYGGPGKKLPEILRLEETLAELDGSLGWTVTLCSGASWFAGFLDKELATEIFTNDKVCFAGSGAVGGTAQQTTNGYRISGYWKYASGALHATAFTANCSVKDKQGNDLLNNDGTLMVKSFILKKDEVTILPGWSYFGLIATGSHAFEVQDVEVPSNRSFTINDNNKITDAGFNYPFLQLAETTLAVNSLGMAKHFLTLTASAFFERTGIKRYTIEQVNFFEQELANSNKELLAVSNDFYNAFDESWACLLQSDIIPSDLLLKVSTQSRKLAHISRQVADKLFPYCGLEAARKETEINRVWRDIHTASQHSLLTF